MLEFIKEQSEKANATYHAKRVAYDDQIKGAIKAAAECGLNKACVSFQGHYHEVELLKRYLEDLGCRNVNIGSNYSWKWASFEF